ncbi:unnamed protein product [Rotaria sp. Silwood2]|nr:unnamed protein product [Rotaria sp. Silwood2]CAF2720549.1 unnamed protein product [Rotaria sp. Silwood2]CAF2969080.1 unnamed protein product [Rotaria sp. Silwood2]CAF3142567.1 unnamed protein product [Rotaria sp. Silwood2]CAF3878969.1 unnamed protein product [Rotaria sp. Silwood2]
MSIIDWQTLFDDIFDGYPDKWTLSCVHRSDKRQNKKLENQRKMEKTGYARFHCPKCSNGWASAKAKVVLYYPNANEPVGRVSIRFFGQQCKKCCRNATYFADPEFEDDWIKPTLEKLYERIGWNCYHQKRPTKPIYNDRKVTNIEGPHEKALCEACQLGCCNQTAIKKNH